MATLVQKGKPPEGAIRITQEEAINLQWKLIYDWKPNSDVWPFRYGMASLAISSGVSAIMIASHFRRKLKLRNFGNFAMYLPNVVVPTVSLPIFHQKIISEPILLQADCPVCIQLRSIFLQNSLSLVYPLVISPITGFMLATTFATTRLPLLGLSNLGTLFGEYRRIIKSMSSRLFGLSLFHTVLAIAVTEAEARSFFKIQRILFDREKMGTDSTSTVTTLVN